MISRSRCRKHILLLLFFCSMVYSIFWNWLKVHNFKTKQVFTETTRNGTTSLQKLFLWMTVIISSTFPAINIQQICVVIKAVFWKNTSAGIGRKCLDYISQSNTIAVDERKHSRCGVSHFNVLKRSNSHHFISSDFNCCVGCIKIVYQMLNSSRQTFGTKPVLYISSARKWAISSNVTCSSREEIKACFKFQTSHSLIKFTLHFTSNQIKYFKCNIHDTENEKESRF